MSELTPCASCAELVLGDPRTCPHCGESRRRASSRAVLLLGLTLSSGCWGGQSLYGVPYTPDTADTGDTGDTTTGSVADD